MNSELENYVLSHIDPEGDYLYRLWRATNVHLLRGRMASGHLQGRLLKMLVRMIRPKNILEEGGMVYTYEINDEQEDFTRPWIENSPVADKIRFIIGDAIKEAPKLGIEFDMAFIDGDKREYPDYYRMLMGDGGSKVLVHSGSILIADNILWSGKIVEPVAHNDRHTQALLEFNRMIREDERVENVIVPIRDGLNLIRVK